jgi:AsmA protein
LIVIVALLAAIAIAIPLFVDANQFRPQLQSKLRTELRRDVNIGALKFGLLSGTVSADDIAIADDPNFSPSPFVRARALDVGFEWMPLIFHRELQIRTLTLEAPEITLIQSRPGTWNFSSLGAGRASTGKAQDAQGPAMSLSIGTLKIVAGRIEIIRDGASKPSVYENVDISMSEVAAANSFPFRLSATLPGEGKINLEGKAGPIHEDAARTPFNAALTIRHLDLLQSGFVEPVSGLKGRIDFDGSMKSDGREALTQGKATMNDLQLVQRGFPARKPVTLAYTLAFDLEKNSGTLRDTTMSYGGAGMRVEGGYRMSGGREQLQLKVRGDRMPVQEIVDFLPAAGLILPKGASLQGGSVDVNLAVEGPFDRIETKGELRVSDTRVTGFDLRSKLSKIASLAGIQAAPETNIEKFASGFYMSPTESRFSNLLLVVPALGELSGDGTIDARQNLNFKMVARLQKAAGLTGSLIKLAGKEGLAIPFAIRGTASDPFFDPSVAGVAGGLLDSVKERNAGKSGGALDKAWELLSGPEKK